jgi:hypothetical protein
MSNLRKALLTLLAASEQASSEPGYPIEQKLFLDFSGGGAWLLLIAGGIRLLGCDKGEVQLPRT